MKQENIVKDLESNKKEIEELQSFRQTKQVKELIRHLFGEQSFLRQQLDKLSRKQTISPEERQKIANQSRSLKMKRSWRYFRAIHQNYNTGKSLRELRSEFSKTKRGLESDVSDVIWRNPSP